MAQSRVVYTDMDLGAPPPDTARLFDDVCFWVAQRCPQRSVYVDHITNNGGRVTRLENQADILIVDHLRVDVPPGSISYRWIEACIREGHLVDKEEHRVGPKTHLSRPVGSMVQPAKTHRVPYTAADDLELWNWVTDCQRQGGKVLGNEIYKQLEEKNPRHTWQSWHDRWRKRISTNPPAGATQPRPPTPPADVNATAPITASHYSDRQRPQPRHRVRAASRELDIPPSSPEPGTSPRGPSPRPPRRQATRPQKPARSATPELSAPQSIAENGNAPLLRASRTEATANGNVGDDSARAESAARETSKRRSATPIQGRRRSVSADNVDFAAETRPDEYPEADYNYLYNMAPEIQNVTVGKYDEFWDMMAMVKPNHSSDEWRRFYEEQVLPVWKVRDSHNFRATGEPSSSPENDALEQRAQAAATSRQVTGSKSPLKRKRDEMDELSHNKKTNMAIQTSAVSVMPRNGQPRSSQVEVIDLVDDADEEAEVDAEGLQQFAREDAASGLGVVKVYESRAVPEGEKENFTLDSNGEPIMSAPHRHVKNEEAFEAFTDPPSDFMLQATAIHSEGDQAREELEDESWLDIDEFQTGQTNPLHAALDVARTAPEEIKTEAALNAAIPQDANEEADPEILDEIRSEWERHESENRSRRSQSPSDQDTQAILNAATQIPDFDVPLPSSDANYDANEGTVHYPRLPRMRQEDDEDEAQNGDTGAALRQRVDQQYLEDEEGDFAFEEPDLDVPPPLGYDLDSQTAIDGAGDDYAQGEDAYLESQLGSQRIKGVSSSLIPPHPSRNQPFKQDPRTHFARPPSSSPQPHSTPPSSSASTPRVRGNLPGHPLQGTNHATISTITVKQEPYHQNPSEPNPAMSSSPAPEHISNRPPSPLNGRLPPSSRPASRPSMDRVLSDAGTQTDDDRPIPPKPVFSARQTNGTTTSAPPTLKRPATAAAASTQSSVTRPPKARFSTGTTTSTTITTTTAAPKKQTSLSLSDFITARRAAGFTTPMILYALQQTNANFGLTDFVLQSLRATGKVPMGVRGVWTDEDDEVMRGGDARAMKALEVLHGVEGFRVRREGLRVRGVL